MQYDYYRRSITDVLAAGPMRGEDFYRVRVLGHEDSKHLNISEDQLRVLADVMDETNPPSLLPMLNNSRVLAADVTFTADGIGTGYVLAQARENEWVTWRVWLHKGQCRWLAEAGEYHSSFDLAMTDYHERRPGN